VTFWGVILKADKNQLPGRILSRLKRELAQREAELAILNSVQQGLASHLGVQAIFDLVGDRICDFFHPEVVMISMYDKETNTVEHRYAIERGERVYSPGPCPPGGFRSQIIQTRKPILVNSNVAELAARLGQPTLPGTITPKSWLGVPMIVGDQVTGVLSLQSVEHENAFRESEVSILQTLAASMSVALENARLWDQENLYRQALEREFEIGREIQAGFLPEILPQPKGWEIAASLKPAREVAGDFFDVFKISEGKVGLVVADVCDKGLGAALFMTLFRSLLRAASNIDFYTRTPSGEKQTVTQRLKKAILLTNNYIEETHGETGMFATVFFGILDTHTGVMKYVNCGHVPPFVINRGKVVKTLARTGPPIGIVSDPVHVVDQVKLKPGDLLFAYSDGICDSLNVAGEAFNASGLILLLNENRSPKDLLDVIQRQVETFAKGVKQFDDITMLAVRRIEI
jgi:serine phosphatase RsbU (regulator of sigma subunit)